MAFPPNKQAPPFGGAQKPGMGGKGVPPMPMKKKGKKPKSRQGAMDAIGKMGLPGYGPND